MPDAPRVFVKFEVLKGHIKSPFGQLINFSSIRTGERGEIP
jgi:hypothetical protein